MSAFCPLSLCMTEGVLTPRCSMKLLINRQPNRKSVYYYNESLNDDFEETLMLLKEWFMIHENMDYVHRTRQVSRRWAMLKLMEQKGVFSNEQVRTETTKIRLAISELIGLI